jgi:hypothetical protein
MVEYRPQRPPSRYVSFTHPAAARPVEKYITDAGIRLMREEVSRGVRFPVFERKGVMVPFHADRITSPRPLEPVDYVTQIAAALAGDPNRLLDGDTLNRKRSVFHLRILLDTSRFTELRRAYRMAMALERDLRLAFERPALGLGLG